MRTVTCGLALAAVLSSPAVAEAQVDQARADAYFKEIAAICERDGGALWGVSLCGPIVVADPVTKTIATNQPAPDAPRPAVLGFANAALNWGGTRWSTLVWQMVPDDPYRRGRLILHELFHRVQPELGLLVSDLPNDHLDTLEGRVWMQLEWRALAAALSQSGAARAAAVRDALAFREKRRSLFDGSAQSERLLEIQEGLAQYTGTVLAAADRPAAIADTIAQLADAPKTETFVRTFAYPSGAAYGLLLDEVSPGWPRRVTSVDDIGAMLASVMSVSASEDADTAAQRYGAAELRASEDRRETERLARVADFRRRFVDGPVIVVPAGRNASFVTTGMTPIPEVGTIFPSYRVKGDWGSLDAKYALISADRQTITLPAPASTAGPTLTGDGWTLTLADGWVVRPGERTGDYRIVRDR